LIEPPRPRMREEEQTERSTQKEEDLERRVAGLYQTRGRRSLLSGRRGGQGFELQASLMSKDKLGA